MTYVDLGSEKKSVSSVSSIIKGTKTDVSTTAAPITATSTPISVVVTIKVRSLGTGLYIAIGDSSSQPFRLTAVGDSHDVDWTNDLSSVYCVTDAGNTGSIEWVGG